MPTPKVAIIYLPFYHNDEFSHRAFASVAAQTYAHNALSLIVINNPHPEFGSYLPKLREIADSYPNMPHVTLIGTETNLGFAGGNNVGMREALKNGADYVLLLNDDAYLSPTCIADLVAAMEAERTIGQAQPLITLHPDTTLVNTAGNALHLFGFGYSLGYKDPVRTWQSDAVVDVGYVSGAVTLMRADLLRQYGLWEEGFFMYHEDTEYSLRLVLRGHRVVCVRSALAHHAYQFLRNKKNTEWMEKSRFIILYLTYRPWTLALLFPGLLVNELVLWLFAIQGGWATARARAFRALLSPRTWKAWQPVRLRNQKERVISDRALLERLTGNIIFQEAQQESWIIRKFANPGITFYLNVLKRLVP